MPRGWLVLGPADDAPVLLAGTAAALWEALEPPCTRDELSERLAHRFGVDAPVVAGDLEAPLTDLAVRGLVHVGADPDAAHTGDADPGDAGRRGAFPS